jgi:CheY-like chemotaxis protein
MAGAKTVGVMSDERSLDGESAAEGSMSKLRAGPSVRPARSGRVLVVDDEVAVGRTIQRLLGDRHDVVVVTGGREGIDLLESGEDFDVILCDMSMPEVTGIDVFTRASARRPELADRFVFMTGGSFNARTRDFFETSTNPRIDKPFDLAALRDAVRDRISRIR